MILTGPPALQSVNPSDRHARQRQRTTPAIAPHYPVQRIRATHPSQGASDGPVKVHPLTHYPADPTSLPHTHLHLPRRSGAAQPVTTLSHNGLPFSSLTLSHGTYPSSHACALLFLVSFQVFCFVTKINESYGENLLSAAVYPRYAYIQFDML